MAGGYAYVVDANNHFYVVNVANPASPTLANAANTFLLTNLVAQSIVLNGTTAYVPAGDAGLVILNVATPAAPTYVGTLATPGQAVAAAVSGTTLYVAAVLRTLAVYKPHRFRVTVDGEALETTAEEFVRGFVQKGGQ